VPRKIASRKLDTRSARRALPIRREPYWVKLQRGLSLGYRRTTSPDGYWIARRYDRAGSPRLTYHALGVADDATDADRIQVWTYDDAQTLARKWFAKVRAPTLEAAGPITIKRAIALYLEYAKAETRSAGDAEQRLTRHVLSKPLANRRLDELTKTELERWRNGMVKRSATDPEVERRSKDTANRVLTMLKAALNRAFADESNSVPTDKAWRTCKPFHDVGRARDVHLDAEQAQRLLNATAGAFRNVVTAMLLTGCRPPPGEIAQVRVRDFRADLRGLRITDSKTGARNVVLTTEGVRFFETMAAGKRPDDLLFPNEDGGEWRKNVCSRHLQPAIERAKLPAGTCMYSLRHSYASQAILAGMSLKLLAENMGTSIKMIEDHYGKFVAASRARLIEETAPKLGLPVSNVTSLKGGGSRARRPRA
jgi:site-specific recombinase XerD